MPKVFGIGLPRTGGDLLEVLFQANGYTWRHHLAGRLAQDIAFARAMGRAPLGRWGQADGYSGLYGALRPHQPHLPAYGMFRLLHRHFPDAYFIHTLRDPAQWVTDRYLAEDGAHRMICAAQLDVRAEALPALWLAEEARHRADTAAFFAGNPRFIAWDLSAPLDDLISALRPDFDLTRPEVLPEYDVSPSDTDQVFALLDHAEDEAPSADMPHDPVFVSQVADHCKARPGPSGPLKALSRTAVQWTEDRGVLTPEETPAPFARWKGKGPFLLDVAARGFDRAQAALNELLSQGARPPLNIDMMDARFIGSAGRRAAPPRTLAYNRRAGACNITLWPLASYHALTPRGAPGGLPADPLPFDQKQDHCVWLGNLTGRMLPEFTPAGREARGVYAIRAEAEGLPPDSPQWSELLSDLSAVPRHRLVRRLRDHPDFTVGFVMRRNWEALHDTPIFDGLTSRMRGPDWFHGFRYVLSLSGNDTGSNFLPAAASNALILKEEDGWELFYTDAFKPWDHYVPLEEGADDAEEKLAWARANPDKAKAMVEAAGEVYDKLANPANRAAYLSAIVSELNADH